MANIIPTTSATGSEPLMLNEHKGSTESGGATSIASVRGTTDKAGGGLDIEAVEAGTSFQVDDNQGGQNGRRYTAGLSNTDLSNAVTGVHLSGNAVNRIDINSVANNGMQMHFINNTGFTNYRSWTVRGDDSDLGKQVGFEVYVIDPSVAGTQADTGTYDDTSLDQFGLTVNTQGGYSANYCWWFFSKQFRVLKTKAGACGFYGTNPSFDDYHTNSEDEAWVCRRVSTGLFRVVVPFKIGDGTTATTFTDNSSTIFTPKGQASGGVDQYHVVSSSYPFYLDLTASCVIDLSSMTFSWGEASPFDFDSSVGASVTINNTVFNGIGDFTAGSDITGSANFTLVGSSKVVIKGADLDGSTINGDAELQGATVTTITDINITGALDFDTAGTYTLDGCTINEVTNSSGGAVTLNLANSTVTTNTGPSITLASSTSFELTGLIAGSEVRVYEAGTTTEIDGIESSGTSFNTTITVSSIDFVVFNTQYQPIRTLAVSTTADVSAPIQQVGDRVYENP